MASSGSEYWLDVHREFSGQLRAVGWPSLSEAYNELKYRSEAETILPLFENLASTLAQASLDELLILELGAGIGYWTSLFADSLKRQSLSWNITCLDVSQSALEHIQARLPNAKTICADLCTVDQDRFREQFHIVTSISVIHHILPIRSFLHALIFAARSVAQGGYVIYYDPILQRPYSPFAAQDWSMYRGNGMPRHLFLLDDVMASEGLTRVGLQPGPSYLLNGCIESGTRVGFLLRSVLWWLLCRGVYVSESRTRALAAAVHRVDRWRKAGGSGFSGTVAVYQRPGPAAHHAPGC